MRVPAFLADHEVPFDTVEHPPAYTAARRARCLGVRGDQLAKCVLVRGPEGFALAVLPATRRLDLSALAAALGGPVRLARCEEIPEVFQDCEWGALAPFGVLYGVPTLLDDSFPADALLTFEAQRHGVAVRLRCRDFERLEQPRRLALSTR